MIRLEAGRKGCKAVRRYAIPSATCSARVSCRRTQAIGCVSQRRPADAHFEIRGVRRCLHIESRQQQVRMVVECIAQAAKVRKLRKHDDA